MTGSADLLSNAQQGEASAIQLALGAAGGLFTAYFEHAAIGAQGADFALGAGVAGGGLAPGGLHLGHSGAHGRRRAQQPLAVLRPALDPRRHFWIPSLTLKEKHMTSTSRSLWLGSLLLASTALTTLLLASVLPGAAQAGHAEAVAAVGAVCAAHGARWRWRSAC